MTVATTVAAFQTLHATITGVVAAPVELPGSLDPDRLPLAFTWPGPSVESGGWIPAPGKSESRHYYIVRCYVAEVAPLGADVDDGYQATLPILQAFGAAYVADAVSVTGVLVLAGATIRQINDSGAVVLEYAGVSYHGFEFRVQILEKVTT